MKNDSSDDVPSTFENSFRSDPACYVAYSKYKHCTKTLASCKESKISRDELSHEIKIASNFNAANSIRRENKVLALKTHYITAKTNG